MLGKIYINGPLLYGMKRTIYTHYAAFCRMAIEPFEGLGCGRNVTCNFWRRIIDLHLLGDIVSLISTAIYVRCRHRGYSRGEGFDALKITPAIGDLKQMTVKPVSPYLWRRVNRRIYEPPICLFAGLEHSSQENL